jgi:hypothetical protein
MHPKNLIDSEESLKQLEKLQRCVVSSRLPGSCAGILSEGFGLRGEAVGGYTTLLARGVPDGKRITFICSPRSSSVP